MPIDLAHKESIGIFWTAVLFCSLALDLNNHKNEIQALALNTARIAWEKDLLYRRWNANLKGVYVQVTPKVQPNPYLSHLPERDLLTPSGRQLTLINPAYMTRQVNELTYEAMGVRGHITSLQPLRKENAPDSWEIEALKAFEQGSGEVASLEDLEGQPYLRLMRPFRTEKGCLSCHAQQGYKEGEIRGGLSVSIPMAPLWEIGRSHQLFIWFSHILVWLVGMAGICWGSRKLKHSLEEQRRGAKEREKLLVELQETMAQVKILRGILPICASCKKIRDDQGYWETVEVYIRDHSEADFSHSICPECAKILYSDLYKKKPD